MVFKGTEVKERGNEGELERDGFKRLRVLWSWTGPDAWMPAFHNLVQKKTSDCGEPEE